MKLGNMKKFPEEMNKKEFKEFRKELERIGKTETGRSFEEFIKEQEREGEKKRLKKH